MLSWFVGALYISQFIALFLIAFVFVITPGPGTLAVFAKSELNIDLKPNLKFIGVFEHFYDDSIFECISTHYVNLAYKVELNMINNLPTQQHNEYRWFTVDELLASKQVHDYVKDYFKDYNAPTN